MSFFFQQILVFSQPKVFGNIWIFVPKVNCTNFAIFLKKSWQFFVSKNWKKTLGLASLNRHAAPAFEIMNNTPFYGKKKKKHLFVPMVIMQYIYNMGCDHGIKQMLLPCAHGCNHVCAHCNHGCGFGNSSMSYRKLNLCVKHGKRRFMKANETLRQIHLPTQSYQMGVSF